MRRFLLSLLALLLLSNESFTQCFTPVGTRYKFGSMHIYVSNASINGTPLEAGDEIGVFDGDLCVGAGILTEVLGEGSDYLEIEAAMQYHRWGGFIPGDTISYRFCIHGEVRNSVVVPSYISNGPLFEVNASCIVQLHTINSPPVVLSEPVTEARPGVAYSYTIVADDIDGDPLIYTAMVLPGWLSFNSTTHTLSATPSEKDIGDQHVTIRVSDGSLYTDHTFIISVDDANHAPTFISEPATSVSVGENYEYTIVAQDMDYDPLTYSVPVIPDWLTFHSEINTISGEPRRSDVGSHKLSVRVSDGSTSSEQHFTVVVRDVNSPPVFTSEPPTNISAGEFLLYQAEARDADGDALSYSAISLPAWLDFDVSNHTLYGIPSNDDAGDHSVTLQVSDGKLTVDQTFVITVDFVYGIPELSSQAGIRIYPNPSHGRFYVEFSRELDEEVRLEIRDHLGRILRQDLFPATYLVREEYSLSTYAPGIYLIRIFNDREQSLWKLSLY